MGSVGAAMQDEFEVSWRKGSVLVKKFYDNNSDLHYRVNGMKRDGFENYDAVRKKDQKSCRRFLRGIDIDRWYPDDTVPSRMIHFREDL